MYRPTVRYDDHYKTYVNNLFHVTTLDRNQIIRLGLFLLGHTKEGNEILTSHLHPKSSLPSPLWKVTDNGYWREQRVQTKEEKDVRKEDVTHDRTTTTGHTGTVYIRNTAVDGTRNSGIKVVL